ncbi:FRIGIDA-like protein [Quillaja saponaria]|uniref:FRIGIDA-like protein n=1 Tax=Quillaja saponaria TaxID=32244 RepID=A0AAD7PVD0_QUISA|nr:FRIGIDA-like protein [Quillaja saponaria]
MAAELVIKTDRVKKFFDDLEAQKSILSTCTRLFTTLSDHFTSMQDSLSQKFQSLESKIQTLESNSQKTLESIDHRENSIPERESAAAARIEEQKEAALAEFENPVYGNGGLSETLKSLSRKMDSSGLLRFIVSKRKESVTLRAEIVQAIAEAVDPPRLVLDALDEFLKSKLAKTGVTDKRWACGMLIQALFPEISSGGKAPEFSRNIVERAASLVESWKGQMDGDSEVGAFGAAEAVMFLQMVVGFRLLARFDGEYLRKLVMEFASRRDMAKLAAALEYGEKMGDIIDELLKNGKEIEAVYFASESGLTGRFPPIDLLKSYLRNSKKNATTILKNGNNSQAAAEESSTMELNSIKAIIKCVEDHKLESDFNLDSLRKRATHLEKAKSERKKNSGASNKPQNKRAYSASGSRGSGPPFRPAKASKYSNAYSSFSRRNPVPPPHPSPATRYSGPYNHPVQTIYDVPPAIPYASPYGVPHTQSPAAVTQQHYPLPVDNMGSAGYMPTGSYAGQTSYSAYDYGNAAPANTYQPPSYTQ